MIYKSFFIAAMLAAFVLAGSAEAQHGDHSKSTEVARAVAVIAPVGESDVHGVLVFTREKDGMRVRGRISGLAPGKHGFHVHEYGDCSGAGGKTAGGHFNPFKSPHGDRVAGNRHQGDLGNITAGSDGVAHVDFVDHRLAFSGSGSIIGRGVIVHGGTDDLTSQPSGAAGPRVGCGTIGIAGPVTGK